MISNYSEADFNWFSF